jgi:hypothetical protein
MAALTLLAIAGCSGGSSAPAAEPSRTVACDRPWESMTQVEACASDDYVEASTEATSAPAEEPSPTVVACDLPWASMVQVAVCRSDDYVVASTEGVEVHVVIRSKDPDAIAAALAGALLDNRDHAEQLVVWGYSDAALVGTGYDRGVVSEQGTLGQGLVFEVCTSWDASEAIGETCGEREVFTVTH